MAQTPSIPADDSFAPPATDSARRSLSYHDRKVAAAEATRMVRATLAARNRR